MNINVAIVGVGNCASSFYQAIHYYREMDHFKKSGLMKNNIGDYLPKHINVVAAFDIDERKVGKSLREGVFSRPNCTPVLYQDVPDGPTIQMGHLLDGVTPLMSNYPEDDRFVIANQPPVDIVEVLKSSRVDILINYLPVGSQQATEFYASACLEAGVALVNCIPVFIASNPIWEQRFIDAGLPLIGDDMKSQFGASILSQMLQELAFSRGHHVKCHIQRNVGGNTDFLNMTDEGRLKYKKESKENVIIAQNNIRQIEVADSFLYAGPSEYIKYYGDNKIAHIHMEMEGLMGSPVTLDAKLSVMDSPNSAGVVIDAVRYLKVALDLKLVGALRGPSAATQKTPPEQLPFCQTEYECDALANRELTELTQIQTSNYNAIELTKKRPSYNSEKNNTT